MQFELRIKGSLLTLGPWIDVSIDFNAASSAFRFLPEAMSVFRIS